MGYSISRRRFLLRSMEGIALAALPLAKPVTDPAGGPLRMGILGLGKRGSALLAACRSATNIDVVAVCDREAAALRQKGAAVSPERRFISAPELRSHDSIDAVAVGTRDALTRAAPAVECGRHVFVVPPAECSPWKGDRVGPHGRGAARAVRPVARGSVVEYR